MKDPIVDEIRYFRNAHSEQFDYDLDAICDDYKLHQVQVRSRLVRLKPKVLARTLGYREIQKQGADQGLQYICKEADR